MDEVQSDSDRGNIFLLVNMCKVFGQIMYYDTNFLFLDQTPKMTLEAITRTRSS